MHGVCIVSRSPVPRLVSRARLTDSLAGAPVGLIEAGSGYGKSVLASQYRQLLGIATANVVVGRADRDGSVFVSSVRRALREARLSDLVAATEDLEPTLWIERLLDALAEADDAVLLVFDDAHNVQDGDGSTMLIRLAQGLPERHRLLVAARSFLGSLEPLWTVERAVRLDGQDLAFTVDEAEELVKLLSGRAGRNLDVRMLVEATHGWATALTLATSTWSAHQRSSAWLGRDPIAAAMRGSSRHRCSWTGCRSGLTATTWMLIERA